MTISRAIADRNIQEVLHFTTNKGVVGVLASGEVKSRARLPADQYLRYILHNNATVRPETEAWFDKSEDWLDYVNLSISEVNRRYLISSQRWHENADIWWVILSYDPVIMAHDHVYFATTNNGYPLCRRAQGYIGFTSLFQNPIERKLQRDGQSIWYARRGLRASHLATCEQAEVLYPGVLSLDFLRRVYVKETDHQDSVCGWLREFGIRDVEVIVSLEKFLGQPN